MAYMSQEMKKNLAPQIKAVLKKYKVKASIGVRNYSTLVVNIKEGAVDFVDDNVKGNPHYQVNCHYADEHYTGQAASFFQELIAAMKPLNTWYDRSDAMTDHFDTAYYIAINLGNYNKSYDYTGA